MSSPINLPQQTPGLPLCWQYLLFIRLSRSANDATDYLQIPMGRVLEVGNAGPHDLGGNPQVSPKLSQDCNSFIVFWVEQNIRLHTHPGLDKSLEVGGRRIEVLPGWSQGVSVCGISCGTALGRPG
jgi:hypothetical protein